MLFKGENRVSDLTIIIAFVAIIAAACGSQVANSDKDAADTTITDIKTLEDATELPKDVTGTKLEDTKYLCYVGCLESETPKEECKKSCYGESDAGSSLPEDVSGTKK